MDVYRILGLEPGDAHVVRNAGGVVTDDVIRSLAISQRKLGTQEIVLVHHTRCGMQGLDEDAFVAELEQDAGEAPTWPVGAFADAEQDVRDSVQRLRDSPFLPHTEQIRGYVYDVDTQDLRPVDP